MCRNRHTWTWWGGRSRTTNASGVERIGGCAGEAVGTHLPRRSTGVAVNRQRIVGVATRVFKGMLLKIGRRKLSYHRLTVEVSG